MGKLRKLKDKIRMIYFFVAYINYLMIFKLRYWIEDIKQREKVSRGDMEGLIGLLFFIFVSSLFFLLIHENPGLAISPYLFLGGLLTLIFFNNFLIMREKNYLPFFKKFKSSVIKTKFYFVLFSIVNMVILVLYIALINTFNK